MGSRTSVWVPPARRTSGSDRGQRQRGTRGRGRIRPQVVFLDLRIPELNGWEVCDQLRDNEITGEAAIFGLMAHSPTEYSARYRRATFDAYLSKPVELDLAGRLVRCAIQ